MQTVQRWSCEALGLPKHATVRCVASLPDDGLALGADYGLVLRRRGHFLPFPFPRGARRESRRVEAMAAHQGVLHVATMKSLYTWPFKGEAAGRGRPSDGDRGFDDLRALHSGPEGLLKGWRTHLEGGEGPPECISFATAWDGQVFAGTIDGALWQVGKGLVRRFESRGRGRPLRHLAFAHDSLWVACDGALHRWDGQQAWTQREGEPYGLHSDGHGRLWSLAQGRLWVSDDGEQTRPMSLKLSRPWALGSNSEGLWIGCLGEVVLVGGAQGALGA